MKKKRLLIILIIILCIILLFFISIFIKDYIKTCKIKNAKVEVVLKEDLNLEFLDKKHVSDFIKSINGKIINDYEIDSTEIGVKNVKFNFINEDGIKLSYTYKVNIVDKTSPIVWLSDSYNIYVGDSTDLTNKILCADNYDNNPNCFIEGNYDYNKLGSYQLVFKAVDNSGNETIKDFTLNVINKNNKDNLSASYTYFSDVLKEHKTDNTKVGIDVSKWQGKIDFNRVKAAGAEFVIIKVGSSKKDDSNYIIDPMFKENIQNAINAGLDVGVYFYSSASSNKDAKKEALWVIDQIKNYEISLPIVFDWENFSSFNDYNLSLFGLTTIADTFLKTIEKNGYDAMLYGSKNYLEKLWIKKDYDVWLAHYTDKTNYDGKYLFWQLCDNGKIDGINGNVDIDIMYLN